MFPLGLLCLLFLHQKDAALEFMELDTHSARIGSNTTIPCKFDVSAVPPAQRTFSILWHFQEKEIFRYPNNLSVPICRLSIDQDRINDGIADLYMSGVSIADGGLYKCFLLQTPGKKEKEIRLDVHAPPRITIPNKNVVITKESVLRCAVSEYYPVDIDIKWLRDGKTLNNITVEKPMRNPDGTYNVRSSVTIIPNTEDRKRIFSCRVQHESLPTPLQEDFHLVFKDTYNSFTVIISSVAAGVLMIIIIIAVTAICCAKKKGKNNPNEANNLEGQNENLTSSQRGKNIPNEANNPKVQNENLTPRKPGKNNPNEANKLEVEKEKLMRSKRGKNNPNEANNPKVQKEKLRPSNQGKNIPNEANNPKVQNENLTPSKPGCPGRINTAGDRGRDSPSSLGYEMNTLSAQQETNQSPDKISEMKSECSAVNVAARRQNFENAKERVEGRRKKKS